MSKPIFLIDSLSAGYGNHTVLNSIHLSIGEREFVSLIGPNGVGKSTLLKVLSGLIIPSSGSVIFDGNDLNNYSRRELASKMSVVAPIAGDIPDFSVKMFLSFGRFPFRRLLAQDNTEESIIKEISELCTIDHLLNRSIKELSAGEFQLAKIARALIQNKNLLLLDEPVANLDYKHLIQIMDILLEFNRTGSTIIAAFHDVNIAAEYSTRIIALKTGSIYFD
ncbi:MAG: ABC transporter ATP-binding protein, partial [Leptospirales bacterium]|nr:ABC transporter ATP-binding protein [Leptospirales bacterium]